jgi:hypothetical protein
MPDDFENARSLITLRTAEGFQVPALVADLGPEATKRFFEFFYRFAWFPHLCRIAY